MYQMISEKASKLELIQRFGHLTLKEIVNQEYPSIGLLERAHGDEKISKAIAVIVADLSSSFSGDLNKDEIIEIATEIRCGLTRNITLEGLYLLCSELKRSSIMKLKVNHVLKAVEAHLNEQSNQHEMRNYNAHLANKYHDPRETNAFDDPEFKKFKVDRFAKEMIEKNQKLK